MASEIEIAESFRARLLRREASAMRAVVRAYLDAATAIKKRIDALSAEVERSGGQNFELGRLLSLQLQIQTEIRRFSNDAGGIVKVAQGDAIELAGTAFSRLPVGAIEFAVGAFESASPLTSLFNSIGGDLSIAARQIIVSGIAQGSSVQAVGRQLRDSLSIGLNRAMTISRTEILNAYRNASLDAYRRNSDVVRGWIWLAALGPRCCLACAALHGTKHELSEPFASHPRCRCVPVPIVDDSLSVQSGLQWLNQQTVETQVEILGAANYRAWQAGQVRLSDFVGEGVGKFGPYRYQRSLKQVLGLEEAKKFYKRAA